MDQHDPNIAGPVCPAIDTSLPEYEKKRAAVAEKAARQFASLAEFASKNHLDAEAKSLAKQILTWYAPDDAKAHVMLGDVREGDVWVTAADEAVFQAGLKAIAAADSGKEETTQSELEKATGWKLAKRRSAHFFFEGKFTDAEMAGLVQRAEAARAAFLEAFSLGADAYPNTIHGIFMKTNEDYSKCVDLDPVVKGSKTTKSAMGYPTMVPLQFTFWLGSHDFDYYRDVAIHESVHLLTYQLLGTYDIQAWINEGLAWYFSARLMKTAQCWCMGFDSTAGNAREEQNPLTWRRRVRQTLQDGTDPDMTDLMEGKGFSLPVVKARKAWSVCDFLLSQKKAEFGQIMDDLRKGTLILKAFQDRLGIKGYPEFQEMWRKWVESGE